MSNAAERHGNDDRWTDVRCRGCGVWIREEFDGDIWDVCDACEHKRKEEDDKKRRVGQYDDVEIKVSRPGYLRCPKTLKEFMITDVGDDYVGNAGIGAWCDDCNTIHYVDA
jgi:hypothetical protein